MRVWLTGLAACLAVQGRAPQPGSYYGAPPGYAPQPYAAVPGGAASQPLLPLDGDSAPQEPGFGYSEPAYAPAYPEPSVLTPSPGYYAPPFLPSAGFFGGRDRFDRGRFDRGGFDRGRFERERFERERLERDRLERSRLEQNRGRELFERERFERSRFRERMQMERPHLPLPQPGPPPALQGPVRLQEFHRPPEGGGRRGLSPEQLRGLR